VIGTRHHGYGLRVPHYAELMQRGSRARFVEVISENFIERGGRPRAVLERVRRDADVALHGVSLSLGGVDPLNERYLDALVALSRSIDACSVSDHLCFGTFGGHYAHDLWPLPRTEEAVHHVARRIARVQDRLKQRILIENVSSYLEFCEDEFGEAAFLAAVVEEADAYVLLDVNNVVVNAKNHGFVAGDYLDALPPGRIRQLHLAGHSDHGTHAIDDHGSATPADVMTLYRSVVRRFGPIPTIVEWDDNVPSLDELELEAARAAGVEKEVLGELGAA
jgi:uncharacterized protein (UPF0276 family)